MAKFKAAALVLFSTLFFIVSATAEAATVSGASVSLSRRAATVSANVDPEGGECEVSLWAGEEANEDSLVQVSEAAPVVSPGQVQLNHTLEKYEKNYYLQVRAKSLQDGTWAKSEMLTAKAADATAYWWDGGESGYWDDPGNWRDNKGGDSLGYPGGASSEVHFNNTKTTIILRKSDTFRYFNVGGGVRELTFVREGGTTNDTKLTATSVFNINHAALRLTLQGAAVSTGAGVTIGSGTILILRDGSDFRCGDIDHSSGGSIVLEGKSTFSCNKIYFGGSEIAIDDSSFFLRDTGYFGHRNPGGRILFKGENPLLRQTNDDRWLFYSNLGSSEISVDFLVPIGGFREAPLQGSAANVRLLGDGAQTLYSLNVLDESPANYVDAEITSPLVGWPGAKGINTEAVVGGNLPSYGEAASDDSFVWDAANTPPRSVGVKIKGSSGAGMLSVSGYPGPLLSSSVSPTYGMRPLPAGGALSLSAPGGAVSISTGARATCTGWKLFEVDPATLSRRLVSSGAGNSVQVEGSDAWQELEWQWKREYRVTLEQPSQGSISASAEWVEDGGSVALGVTPPPGYGFSRWTGIADERKARTEDAVVTVDGPATIGVQFKKAYYVSPAGNDSNGGTGFDDALRTLEAALAKDGAPYIYVADGLYELASPVVVAKEATISGVSGEAKAVFKATGKMPSGSVFELNSDDALLRDIAITTAYAGSGDFGRGVYIAGKGIVDSCVITNCRGHYNGHGGGAYLNGDGTVRRSLIDYNSTYASGGNCARGHSIYMKNGLVEECVITRGGVRFGDASAVGGVHMENGILRSSLVAGCTHSAVKPIYGSGIDIRKGRIENCTIAGNYHANSAVPGIYLKEASSVSIVNTIVRGNTTSSGEYNYSGANSLHEFINTCSYPALPGEGNISIDPQFKDPAALDFRPGLTSLADGGVLMPWMSAARDPDGNPRITGAMPDIGAFEYACRDIGIGFEVETSGALGSADALFKALVYPSAPEGLLYTWTCTDKAGNRIERSGEDLAELSIPALPAGIYDVELAVSGAGIAPASIRRENCVKVSPRILYLAKTGSSVPPYATDESAATNIFEALQLAEDGATIEVLDGWHLFGGSLTIDKGVKILSRNGPGKCFFHAPKASNNSAAINIAHPDAVIGGITISGIAQDGKTRPQGWAGVEIGKAGGMLTNCVVTGHYTVNNTVDGSGARLYGGTAVDCVFSNNWTKSSGGIGLRGGAVYISGSGALVDRCIISGNKLSEGSTSYGGGVYINSGMIRNSLIKDNYSQDHGGGLAIEGGKAVHLTVVNNRSRTSCGGIWQNGGTVLNCLSYSNYNSGLLEDIENPGFADFGGGDYTLVYASPFVDAAVRSDCGEFDLAGNARICGAAADFGCYEFDQSAESVSIFYEKKTVLGSGSVVLNAKITPDTIQMDDENSYWTIDGTEPGPGNYAMKGICATGVFEPGLYTIRFKTIVDGRELQVENRDWLMQYGETVYLSKTAPNPTPPYATEETAAKNFAEAISHAMAGATILVDDGTYIFYDTYLIDRDLAIRSKNGPGAVTFDAEWRLKFFDVRSGDFLLDGIRLYRGYTWNTGGAASMKSGTITNCVFEASCCGNGSGGALYMEGGLCVDSVFTNNYQRYNGGTMVSGGAVRISGADAVLDRALVIGCTDTTVSKSKYTSVVEVTKGSVRSSIVTGGNISGTGAINASDGATVANCTVTGNASRSAGYCGGINAADATVSIVNCLVYGNRDSVGAESNASGSEAAFGHCAIPGGYGANSVSGRVNLSEEIPFSPGTSSPLRDAGFFMPWMENARDFLGNARVYGSAGKVDIGAVEVSRSRPLVFLVR